MKILSILSCVLAFALQSSEVANALSTNPSPPGSTVSACVNFEPTNAILTSQGKNTLDAFLKFAQVHDVMSMSVQLRLIYPSDTEADFTATNDLVEKRQTTLNKVILASGIATRLSHGLTYTIGTSRSSIMNVSDVCTQPMSVDLWTFFPWTPEMCAAAEAPCNVICADSACVRSASRPAYERSFVERVRQAKQIEDTPDGKAYQKVLWKQAGDYTAKAMQRCFPKGVQLDTNAFTLVGDIGGDAHIHGVEVRPATLMARCFADTFSLAPFPEVPAAFVGAGLPLEIDVKVKP